MNSDYLILILILIHNKYDYLFLFIFDKLLRFTDQNLLRKKSKISSKIIEIERSGDIIQHVRTAIRHCFATLFFYFCTYPAILFSRKQMCRYSNQFQILQLHTVFTSICSSKLFLG